MEDTTMVKENVRTARDFFESYTAKFLNNTDANLAASMLLMKDHSLRVATLSAQIAANLELEEDRVLLSEMIGLLHDVGRFEQLQTDGSFDDQKSEDHGETALSLLNEQDFYLALPEKQQKIITAVIRNHTKEAISLKDDEQNIQFSQILRDADKLDLWKICVENLQRNGTFKLDSISWNLPHISTVNRMILKNIRNNKPVRKKDVQSVNDFKLMVMSMVFDLNFRYSFQLLSEKQWIKKLYDSMSKRDEVIDAYRELRLFIENKFVE